LPITCGPLNFPYPLSQRFSTGSGCIRGAKTKAKAVAAEAVCISNWQRAFAHPLARYVIRRGLKAGLGG